MSWNRAKKQTLESIAARAGCEPAGQVPDIFGPTAERLTASIATAGLFVLDGLFRANVPVSATIEGDVLAGMHNNVTPESAERASDFLARALLLMGFYSPFSQQVEDPIEGRLVDYYNHFRPHPEDLDELEAMAQQLPSRGS